MTGETPFEAFESFARPFQAAFRCVTPIHLGPRFKPVTGAFQTLTFDTDFEVVPLRRRNLPPLYLEFLHHFRLLEAADATDRHERFQIQPVDYFYTLSDHRNSEILSYHWHPEALRGARPEPHLHVKIKTSHPTDPSLDALFPDLHLPTGHVGVADVIRLLIEQFEVTPLHREWDAVLSV